MYRPGLRILQLVIRTLNKETVMSSLGGTGWDWQSGRHMADAGQAQHNSPISTIQGRGPCTPTSRPTVCTLKKEWHVIENHISNLNIHQQGIEYINYSISNQSNTGVLVNINHKVLQTGFVYLKSRITFI